MEPERSHLDSVVLPVLWQRFGPVELCWSAPAETAEDLRKELELARRSDFFVALIGESCGPKWPCPPGERSQFPPEVLEQSQFEIEIRAARERTEPSFIYFRAEDFEQSETSTPDHPRHDEPRSPDKFASLKKWIQDVWPVRRPYRSPDELAGFMLEDLGAAISDRQSSRREAEQIAIPPPAPSPEEHAPSEPYLDQNVQFTVFRPDAIEPNKWHPLIAFAHLSEKRPDAPDDEPDPLEEVQRQAQAALEGRFEDYQDLTQDSTQGIPREGELTFVPLINEITFNPAQRKFLWTEPVHREEFRMRTQALPGQTLRGSLSVFLGRIILAEIRLAIRVAGSSSGPKPAARPASVTPYRKIFASYSHKDQDIAEEFARMTRAFGDEYLRDFTHLRAGEVWNERLLGLIDEADVFQLLWSSNSMRSPYVRKEWEHALSLRRPNFIRPTYWEQPMPASPAENLPPVELARLQFIPLVGDPPAPAMPLARKRLDETWTMPGSAPAEHDPPHPAREPLPTAAPPASPPAPEASPIKRAETATAQPAGSPAPARQRRRGLFGVLAVAAVLVSGGLFLTLSLPSNNPAVPDRLAALEENVRTSTTPSKVLPELIGLVNASAGTSFSTADQERLARAAITLSRRLEKVAIEKKNDERANQAGEAASLAEKAAKRSGKRELEHEVLRLQEDVNQTRATLLNRRNTPGYDTL
jgi:TIR domain